jgi:hypothetical protein
MGRPPGEQAAGTEGCVNRRRAAAGSQRQIDRISPRETATTYCPHLKRKFTAPAAIVDPPKPPPYWLAPPPVRALSVTHRMGVRRNGARSGTWMALPPMPSSSPLREDGRPSKAAIPSAFTDADWRLSGIALAQNGATLDPCLRCLPLQP